MLLITELAHELWSKCQENQCTAEHFDCFELDLDSSAEISIPMITQEIMEYLSDVHHSEGKTSLSVRCIAEYRNGDSDLFDQICQFLFVKSNASHYLVRSAAFDKEGGYSHQWVGYWEDGQIVREHTDAFFERFFQQTPTGTLSAV